MTISLREHPTDDALILHFYGESREAVAVQIHLAGCKACARQFEEIASTLTLVQELPPPARHERYGLEVWQRIRAELPVNRPLVWWPRHGSLMAAAVASVVVVAFLAGRYWPAPMFPAPAQASLTLPDAGHLVRLAALADHLDRSERVLIDISHAGWSSDDLGFQQSSAADLVDANRLHRAAAVQAGDATIAAVLDDIERNLLDIIHSPATLTPAEIAAARARLDAAALLFKVRILSNELRERERTPVAPRKTT